MFFPGHLAEPNQGHVFSKRAKLPITTLLLDTLARHHEDTLLLRRASSVQHALPGAEQCIFNSNKQCIYC